MTACFFKNPAGWTGGIGTGLVGDALIVDGTNSPIVLKMYGSHTSLIDTTSVTSIKYIMNALPDQLMCFATTDDCITDLGSHAFAYQSNGGQPLVMFGTQNGINGVGITSGETGYGPIVRPTSMGSDANIPLNLSGAGASPVQVLGGLSVTGQIVASAVTGVNLNATGVATIGTLKTGAFVNTTCGNTGYVRIQDSTGTSRKVMICG